MEKIFEQDMTGLKQAVIDITGRSIIHIEMDGISHNYGGYEKCVIRASSDGGTTWINPAMIFGANASAAQAQKLVGDLILTRDGNGMFESCTEAVPNPSLSVIQLNSDLLKYRLQYGVEINALEFRTNNNRTIDGGFLRVYADCICTAQ